MRFYDKILSGNHIGKGYSMKTKMLTILSGIVIAMLLLPVLAGCGQSEESQEPDYASVATDTTLQGLSEKDLAKYVQYSSPQFKDAVTQDMLDRTADEIGSQYGVYESKEFLYVEEQEGYTIVHYKAKYSKGEVGIRMVFDADHLIAGQWFE
jgi:uncharacterized lipoprotein YehR (DUF1307 family)